MNSEFFNMMNEGIQSLIEWQYCTCGGFYKNLWDAIAVADEAHLSKIAKGFPLHIEAYRSYTKESGWWQEIQKGLEV